MWLLRAGRHEHSASSTIKRLQLENARLQARLNVLEVIIEDYRNMYKND
jgi:hypothetical protein